MGCFRRSHGTSRIFSRVYALIMDRCGIASLRSRGRGRGGTRSLPRLVPLTVLGYLDLNTLVLLAGMMVIVALARDSGLFDWLAMPRRFPRSAGDSSVPDPRPLSPSSRRQSSALLDNVTTVRS